MIGHDGGAEHVTVRDGIDGAGILGGVSDQRRQVDGLPFEWSSLVEAGEQQQVVDEPCHPGRLAVDAPHRRVEVGGTVGQPVLEQLRVTPDRGERGPQLVRRIGHEAPEPCLGRLAFPETPSRCGPT